jgi:hypothetical protein
VNRLSRKKDSRNDIEVPSMKKTFLAVEFWEFLRIRKRFWLLPIVLMLLLFGGAVALTESSAVAPLIYALF